jgi:hypothetical protein
MKVTREVVQDLLPLYLAGEVSEGTRELVESYLKTDPELAQAVELSKEINLNGELAVSRNEEDALKTYQKSRAMLILFVVVMASIMACVIFAALYSFFTPS